MNELLNDINALLSERPIPKEKIAKRIALAALDKSPEDIEVVVSIAEMNDAMDQLVAVPAMALLPAWGNDGIDALLKLAFTSENKFKTLHNAIQILVSVSLGVVPSKEQIIFLPENWEALPKYEISDSLQAYCSRGVKEQVLISLGDQEKRKCLFLSFGQMSPLAKSLDDEILTNHLMDMVVDSHLILNRSLIDRFSSILDAGPEKEEDLQKFLTSNPIILDPFTKFMHSKLSLGSDFITDYVIRRMNDEYILVEIENSTDKLFKKSGNFSSELSEAIGQVRDFQAWIGENLHYARKKLENIVHPQGLVVIGRSKSLDAMQKRRLVEENHSRRGHIKIVTYDDLLDQAKTVHKNLITMPMVLNSKESKVI